MQRLTMWSTNRRGSFLRSSLLILTSAACVTVIYIYLARTEEKLTEEKCIPVCDSKECVLQANRLLSNMNPTFDPCDNFRLFLCGGLLQTFGPDDRGGVVVDAKHTLLIKLKGILDNVQAESGSASAKMKVMYDSCMNYRSSEIRSVKDFKKFLNNLGILNWPNLAPDFKFTDTNLPTILANLKAYGGLVNLNLRLYEGNQQTEEKYLNVVFRFQNFNESTNIPREAAVHILKYFDLGLDDIEIILKDHEDVRNSILYLKEDGMGCEENCSDVHVDCLGHRDDDWRYLCETVEAFLNVINLNDRISKNSIIINKNQDVFLKNLLPRLNSSSDRSVANFLALNFLRNNLRELNLYFWLTQLKYFPRKLNKQEKIDRWKYCVKWMSQNMKFALQNEFFLQHFTRTVIEEILELYPDYTSDAGDMIALQDWIPSEEKSFIENSIRNLSTNILSLKQLLPNETFANEFFKKFHPTSESFFRKVLQFKLFNSKLLLLSKPKLEHSALYDTDLKVGATTDGRFIDLHFGMFFLPFHLCGLKKQINRIMLAPVFGHQIGHNILNMLDELLETHNRTRQTFLEKRHCLENQFSKFKFEILNENLNGTIYFDENFSDNVAETFIDKILEKYNSPQEEILLPGLPYSTKKLLYMGANQVWCSKSNLKEEIHFKTERFHAPHGFRLTAKMQNSKGFSEAFRCPVGSYMNPTSKCSFLDTF